MEKVRLIEVLERAATALEEQASALAFRASRRIGFNLKAEELIEDAALLRRHAGSFRKPEGPDQNTCKHIWEYQGTDYHGSRKGEDSYTCRKCRKSEYH